MTRRKALRFALPMVLFGLVGGFLTGSSTYQEWTPELQALLAAQVTPAVYCAVVAVQGMVYAGLGGYFGALAASRSGLWKELRLHRGPLVTAVAWGLGCGLFLCLDRWTFALWDPAILSAYTPQAINVPKLLSGMVYGGVVEELLFRLLLMSLLVWGLGRLAARGKGTAARWVLPLANILAALLFAVGHLPATAALFPQVTPLLVVRCLVLNVPLGLSYGFLYRKYGIQYAMLAHALTHVGYEGVFLLLAL